MPPPVRLVAIVAAVVALQVVVLSTLTGGSLLLNGTFLSRALVIAIVSVTTFACLNTFYCPRIKSSSKKAVLITGCDSGFGFALAKRLESQGFTVFACCLNAQRALESLSGSAGESKHQSSSKLMHVLQMDVTSDKEVEDSRKQVFQILRREEKYLWAVINNAGIGHLGFIEMLPLSAYDEVYRVNTLGVVRVTQAFLPLLRGHGRVINVTSLASRVSMPYFSAYSMSKYATLAFSDCLRREMIPFKVKVVTVEPSRYRTEILSSTKNVEYFSKLWDTTAEHVQFQYGREYYNQCGKCLGAHLNDARPNINEVLDTIETAVWTVRPNKHYIPYMGTVIIFKILSCLPERMLDKMAVKLLPKDVKPSCTCNNASSSKETKKE